MNELMKTITAQRHELADVLDSLTPAQWDTPSLCEGWRVHEVVAHLTMQYRYSMPRFLLEMARSRGNFNRMADRCARRDAQRMSPAELAATIRANVDNPWQPPGGGLEGALSHDVIHSLDIAIPLGLDWEIPAHRLRTVLSGLTVGRANFFGVDLTGIQLCATDTDWTYGAGNPVTGTAKDLLLYVCGRATR
jgi:uncharacterized protein (TIGR03083 family)